MSHGTKQGEALRLLHEHRSFWVHHYEETQPKNPVTRARVEARISQIEDLLIGLGEAIERSSF